MNTTYENAKARFASLGIDTDKVIEAVRDIPISLHCWQGDDVGGFDNKDALSGGIQVTGNYPGKARTPAELMADMDLAMSFDGGKKKVNVHANYAIFADGEFADRDAIEPKHFKPWVDYAKAHGMGLDFNATFFSHPKAAAYSLTSPDEEIRQFWVRHAICCVRIAEYFADETGVPCVLNIWIPDGLKDTPSDRRGPRARYMKSMDEILAAGYDTKKVWITIESKVFGIGMESYTAGSAEFALGYALSRHIVPLMDNGHYHPTEVVSDKISSVLLLSDRLALHVTRGVRWDSDHVLRLDDETQEIAKEIVASGRLNDIAIALDYFDGSINRIAAWTVGLRNMRKALLRAMLMPHAEWNALQDAGKFTELLVRQEEWKSLPWEAVWDAFCEKTGTKKDGEWFPVVQKYENEVLSLRK